MTDIAAACFDPPALVQALQEQHGEVPTDVGVTANGWLSILFVDPVDGSWTLALQQPGGPMCLVAAGKDWESIAPLPGDPA